MKQTKTKINFWICTACTHKRIEAGAIFSVLAGCTPNTASSPCEDCGTYKDIMFVTLLNPKG